MVLPTLENLLLNATWSISLLLAAASKATGSYGPMFSSTKYTLAVLDTKVTAAQYTKECVVSPRSPDHALRSIQVCALQSHPADSDRITRSAML